MWGRDRAKRRARPHRHRGRIGGALVRNVEKSAYACSAAAALVVERWPPLGLDVVLLLHRLQLRERRRRHESSHAATAAAAAVSLESGARPLSHPRAAAAAAAAVVARPAGARSRLLCRHRCGGVKRGRGSRLSGDASCRARLAPPAVTSTALGRPHWRWPRDPFSGDVVRIVSGVAGQRRPPLAPRRRPELGRRRHAVTTVDGTEVLASPLEAGLRRCQPSRLHPPDQRLTPLVPTSVTPSA